MNFAFFFFVFLLLRDQSRDISLFNNCWGINQELSKPMQTLLVFVVLFYRIQSTFDIGGHLLQNHDLMSGKIKGVDSNSQCLFGVNFITDSVLWEGVHQRWVDYTET